MKTRKLLALLLMLPLLAYCGKPDPDNGQEQGQEQGQEHHHYTHSCSQAHTYSRTL